MSATTIFPPLVDATGLAALLGSPRLIVVDCRFDLTDPAQGRRDYGAGHVPGAVFASMEHDLSAPVGPRTGRHPLPTPAAFAHLLGQWGFTPDSHVVAYDQASGAGAARLWWMLRARGHARVQVLDGGWKAWLAHRGPVSTTAPAPAPAPTEVPARDYAGVLDAAQVAAGLAQQRITLVDARAADRFAGRNETIDPVAGHVPGAQNHPFTQNLDAAQCWLAPAQLRQRWAPLLQRSAGRPMVMMCGSGITACHNLLALELAGHTDTRLYAGSWSEWITDPARPVATGEDA
jgi:thiosulfate/3-mercaptopyruvate sulfurtransferase